MSFFSPGKETSFDTDLDSDQFLTPENPIPDFDGDLLSSDALDENLEIEEKDLDSLPI